MPSKSQPVYNRRRAKRRALAAIGGLPEKRPQAGQNVSHAHNTTKRLFKPNLQKTKVLVDGKLVSVRIDTRTMRSLTKQLKDRPKRAPAKKKAAAKPAASKKAAPPAAAKK